MRPIHSWPLALCNQLFTIGRSLFALCYQLAHFSALKSEPAERALPYPAGASLAAGANGWRTLHARFKVRNIVRRGQSVTGQRGSISLRSSARR
jgi:hypothetical protein